MIGQTIYPIGTILTRREPLEDPYDEVQVIGAGKDAMIVTPVKEFGANKPLSNTSAREKYTTDIEETSPITHIDHQRLTTFTNGTLSPNDVFASQEGHVRSDGLTRVQRAALAEQVKVDTGLPTITELAAVVEAE